MMNNENSKWENDVENALVMINELGMNAEDYCDGDDNFWRIEV